MKRYGFSKRERLKKDKDFQRVFKTGQRLNNGVLIIYVLPNELSYRRLGIIAERKLIRKATQRNRLKRLVHEAFRLNKNSFPEGIDMIVRVKQTALRLEQVTQSMLALLNPNDQVLPNEDAQGELHRDPEAKP